VLLVGGRDGELCPPNAACSTDGTPLADGAALDRGTGRWRTIADAPVPVTDLRAQVIGQVAYFLPHPFGPGAGKGLLTYRVDEDRWQWQPVPFGAAEWYQLAVAEGRLVAYLGSDEQVRSADYLLDPETGSWTELPPDPLGELHSRTMAWTGDELVLFGNPLEPARSGPPVVRAAALELATEDWRALPDSEILASAPWLVADGSLVNPTLGDADGGEVDNWGHSYPYGGRLDLQTGQWSPLPEPPAGIDHAAGAYAGSTAIYHGVRDAVLDAATGQWVRLPAIPDSGVTSRTVVAAGTDLVAFGGVAWDGGGSEPHLSNRTWTWRPADS
jgi:hypothetical protein